MYFPVTANAHSHFRGREFFVISRGHERGITLVNYEYLDIASSTKDETGKRLMKIHEGSSVAVIVKYSVLQITLSLLYLTSEIETNFVETCTAIRTRFTLCAIICSESKFTLTLKVELETARLTFRMS